jgi:2-C-methyl-D-erythritol 4-phosphate cytidylyltransferase
MSVWAILVAAGRGERLGLDQPKAFAKLGDDPLLAEPLRRLDQSEWIDRIVIVAPPEWEEPSILLAEELACSKVHSCVAGGATRSDSVRAGLAEVASDALVVPGLPISDTLKRVGDDGAVLDTVARDRLYAVQTPQAFLAEVLRRAAAGGEATDCAGLVEAAGGRVKVVEGDPRLLKVTTTDDLAKIAAWL